MRKVWPIVALAAVLMGGCIQKESSIASPGSPDEPGFAALTNAGTGFRKLPGKATDVAFGSGGRLYVVGFNGSGYTDHEIWYMNENGTWIRVPGLFGVRIAVEGADHPWVVNSAHQIFRWSGLQWDKMPGLATDIAAGGLDVYVTGYQQPQPQYGYPVYKFGLDGSNWAPMSGLGIRIAAAPDGRMAVVNSTGQQWRFERGNTWVAFSGKSLDVAGNYGKTETAGGVYSYYNPTSTWEQTTCYTDCTAQNLAFNPVNEKFAFTDANYDIYIQK